MRFLNKALTLVFICCTVVSEAAVKLPLIFQSHMVLQRNKTLPIWGFAGSGEQVSLSLKGQSYTTVTDDNGNWRIELPPQIAGGPFEIVIKGEASVVELKNILFGDVWICSGQSNMQFTVRETGRNLTDTARLKNPMLRLFTASIDMDFVPRKDLAGGSWQVASAETIKNFSAAAYFFGDLLQDSLDIPIGLISNNLGATTIETWMSPQAIGTFPQFSSYYNKNLKPAKSFKEVTNAFERMKSSWEKKYYLKGRGIKERWYLPETDISDWKKTEVPAWWEDRDLPGFDGAVWFRKSFDLPPDFKGETFPLALNQIDDYDIVWINGQKVGEGYGNQNWRNYKVPANILKTKGNVIVVRVFDTGGNGGLYSSSIWGNPILLGTWLIKPDLKIDSKTFPKPHVVNVSPFSSPSVLFNGNIAPLTDLAIKGIIWYQGESNASRAQEYKSLFPAMIKDWRAHFKQGDIPFLFVQLANYMKESATPQGGDWAELREAQSKALSIPNTGMAVAIDLGEENDIHPKNKYDVGYRLGIEALNVAYQKKLISRGPEYESMEILNDVAVVHFTTGSDRLITKNKYGYVSGFAIAGSDRKFYWAKATLQGNMVMVSSKEVKDPVAVRYCWSDNPGSIDLYNEHGLPAAPFRTDDFPLSTAGKVYSERPQDY